MAKKILREEKLTYLVLEIDGRQIGFEVNRHSFFEGRLKIYGTSMKERKGLSEGAERTKEIS